MERFVLTDALWAKMEPDCLASRRTRAAVAATTGASSRRFCGWYARAVRGVTYGAFFGQLKELNRIAMRADKTETSFSAIIHLAVAVINSR